MFSLATMSSTGIIFDLRRFSIHDGPGIRTTVFFKGCPLRCAWCHNPESQAIGRERIERKDRCLNCGACRSACPQEAITAVNGSFVTDEEKCQRCGACAEVCVAEARQIAGRETTVADILATIERDVPFYDQSGGGATFSGGEPLLQPGFLLALLQGCQERSIHTALDTSGYANWEILDRVRSHVDVFLYDVKLIDPERHRHYTGVPNERILDNLRRLAGCGHVIELRVPVLPGINDDEANLQALGDLASSLPGVRRVSLLPYHRAATNKYEQMGKPYLLPELCPPSGEKLAEITHTLSAFGLQVQTGG